MANATVSLFAAVDAATRANPDRPAVSVYPQLRDGHPVAEVGLLRGSAFKMVTEKLD